MVTMFPCHFSTRDQVVREGNSNLCHFALQSFISLSGLHLLKGGIRVQVEFFLTGTVRTVGNGWLFRKTNFRAPSIIPVAFTCTDLCLGNGLSLPTHLTRQTFWDESLQFCLCVVSRVTAILRVLNIVKLRLVWMWTTCFSHYKMD